MRRPSDRLPRCRRRCRGSGMSSCRHIDARRRQWSYAAGDIEAPADPSDEGSANVPVHDDRGVLRRASARSPRLGDPVGADGESPAGRLGGPLRVWRGGRHPAAPLHPRCSAPDRRVGQRGGADRQLLDGPDHRRGREGAAAAGAGGVPADPSAVEPDRLRSAGRCCRCRFRARRGDDALEPRGQQRGRRSDRRLDDPARLQWRVRARAVPDLRFVAAGAGYGRRRFHRHRLDGRQPASGMEHARRLRRRAAGAGQGLAALARPAAVAVRGARSHGVQPRHRPAR